jgi:YHS domain-containing protein
MGGAWAPPEPQQIGALMGGGEFSMAKDPVCGMQVNEQQAAGTSEHQGETYYFCSAGCKQRFDQDPERYTGQGTTSR